MLPKDFAEAHRILDGIKHATRTCVCADGSDLWLEYLPVTQDMTLPPFSYPNFIGSHALIAVSNCYAEAMFFAGFESAPLELLESYSGGMEKLREWRDLGGAACDPTVCLSSWNWHFLSEQFFWFSHAIYAPILPVLRSYFERDADFDSGAFVHAVTDFTHNVPAGLAAPPRQPRLSEHEEALDEFGAGGFAVETFFFFDY